MKLRNKKTGKTWVLEHIAILDRPVLYENGRPLREYTTLAELNEEWEDCKEPLIKDEKIRKVVRAWAEANGVSEVFSYETINGCPYWYIMTYRGEGGLTLDLWGEFPKELTSDKNYTIAELCGEEGK